MGGWGSAVFWCDIAPWRSKANIAASGFHLFQYLKEFFGFSSGQWFNDKVKIAVMDWASLPAAIFFDIGNLKLLERYEIFLNKIGNYVEM